MNWRKLLKISLIALGSLLLVSILTLSAFVYWVLYHPGSVWNFASKYFLPKDLQVTWDSIDYDWQMESWKTWHYQWQSKKFHVVKGSPSVDVELETAEVRWSLHLFSDKPLLDFETLTVHMRDGSYLQVEPSVEPSPEQSPYQMITQVLGYISRTQTWTIVRVVDVQVPGLQVRLPEGAPWDISASIQSDPSTDIKEHWLVKAVVKSQTLTASAEGVIDSSLFETDKNFLDLRLDVQDELWKVSGPIFGVYKEDRVEFRSLPLVEVKGEKNKWTKLSPELHALLQEDAIDVDAKVKVSGIPGPIVHLDKIKAKVRIPLEDDKMWGEEASTLHVESPVDLFLIDKNMRPPLEKACRCKLPEEFLIELDAKMWMRPLTSETKSKEKAIDAFLKMESVENKLFSADAAVAAEVFKDKKEWIVLPKTKADVTVHSFQGLRQFLDAKGIMIPAPVDILDGKIHISADSPIHQGEENVTTVVQITTDLKSSKQKVVAGASVTLEFANTMKALEVDVDAIIKSLILELPPLDPVLGVPSLAADSRILKAPIKKVTKSNFVVNVFTRLTTEKAGAIQLLTKYAEPHIPVSVTVNSRNAEAGGFINVEPFLISYLRRDLHIEGIKVTIDKDDEKDMPLQGRLRIEQGGYKIFITLSGSAQSPNITFSSEPNLSKNDIISVLLYGRVSDQLVSAEAETAGNFNAALADRAVGLFGLWVFASTPIQSFSYNATTKVYTATVNLGDGLTAGVGTNWEQATNFELRKRLSRRWVLTAVWAPSASQNSRQEGRLVLQWEKRF